MTKLVDLSGMRFARLLVVRRDGSDAQGFAAWLCLCDCWSQATVSGAKLRRAHTKSCGCLKSDAESPKDRIARCTTVDQTTGCWNWSGSLTSGGYGRTFSGRGTGQQRHEGAHRLAWLAFNGEIPNAMHVLHKCDNPRCCNPAHLFLGTHEENMMDMYAKGRGPHGKNAPRNARGGA